VFDKFDPGSAEGKKAAEVVAKPKRRGRKPKRGPDQIDRFGDETTTDGWERPPANTDDYEKEVEGEEYDFTDPDEYNEFFDD
jgi:hypothetical protein